MREPKSDRGPVCLLRDRILSLEGLGTEWEPGSCLYLLLKFSQLSVQPKNSLL